MDQYLIFLAVIHLDGSVTVVTDQTVAAVLTDGQQPLRVSRVVLVAPLGQTVHIAAIPAKIVVPTLRVGELLQRVIPFVGIFVG